MSTFKQTFAPALVSGLIIALVATQTAIAQNPAADAAQQASQQAVQQQQQQLQQQQIQQQQQQDSSTPVPQGPVLPASPQVPAGGPVPARIASAHTVVLTNLGIAPRLGFDSNGIYNDVRERLEQWGYFQLVSDPAQADLIFQYQIIDPRNGGYPVAGTYGYRTPVFRIVIVDARTGVPLWTVTSPIIVGSRKTYAHFLDVSETNLITRLKAVVRQPVTAQEQAALTEHPPSHTGLIVALAVGVPVIAGVGTYLLFRHSVNNAKADQDAFCNAHNIPLSMCAGG